MIVEAALAPLEQDAKPLKLQGDDQLKTEKTWDEVIFLACLAEAKEKHNHWQRKYRRHHTQQNCKVSHPWNSLGSVVVDA